MRLIAFSEFQEILQKKSFLRDVLYGRVISSNFIQTLSNKWKIVIIRLRQGFGAVLFSGVPQTLPWAQFQTPAPTPTTFLFFGALHHQRRSRGRSCGIGGVFCPSPGLRSSVLSHFINSKDEIYIAIRALNCRLLRGTMTWTVHTLSTFPAP